MKPWSDDEINTLVSKLGNTPLEEISASIGRSIRSIMSRANYLGYRTTLTTTGKPALLRNPRAKRSKFIFTPEECRKMGLIKLMLARAQSRANVTGKPINLNLDAFAAAYREYRQLCQI